MHYYKRNLGDYAKKTGRLTMLQHGAYTLLIDACYDREVFPTLEQAVEWTWASSEAEVEAVKFVLNRFFSLDKEGQFVQDRILEELLHYHANADTNKRIAIERESKRREKSTKREQIVDEAPPNQEPRTTKHKPIDTPSGVSDSVWQEFKSIRKAKKAPITQRVLEMLQIEADKAGWTLEQALSECCLRGWQAFKADWVKDKTFAKQDIIHTTVPGRQERDPALAKLDADRQLTKPPSLDTLARLAALRQGISG